MRKAWTVTDLLKRTAPGLLCPLYLHVEHLHGPRLPGGREGANVLLKVRAEGRFPCRPRLFRAQSHVVAEGQFQFVQRNVQMHRHVILADLQCHQRRRLQVSLGPWTEPERQQENQPEPCWRRSNARRAS